MSHGIYTALAGAVAQQDALDVVAQNVANANTTGYRAERVTFEEVLKNTSRQVVSMRGEQDHQAGPLVATEQPLDVALEGEGAIHVRDGNGLVHLMRGGHLTRDAEGTLVDLEGRAVLGTDGAAMVIPPDARDITIGEDGRVDVDGASIGQLALSGAPRVVAGAIEGSNVNVVRSLVDLVKISRSYEAMTRMIEGYKAIDDRTARELGNPR